MHLKSLELLGFKSFGRKTVFEFQPGVTAIIGPNGSGKSNICDALRWVLGEQSAKALRGNKMAEVIYAGSSQLRPSAFAQVKLILDNEDRMMPVDFSEVTIGRQLFRSGESNYYFNTNRTLLSDIREMLMDTGIGKDGYSVIGQGDIDDIIFQRTSSRRALIEEAAGITKFKHRKANTLQKLDHTRANITRLQDIVGEIEGQLGPLAEQAAKTRKYQALAAEIRGLEIDLVLFDLSQLYGDHENVDSMRRGLQAKITEVEQFLAEIGQKKSAARERLATYDEKLRDGQRFLRDKALALDSLRDRTSALKEEARGHQSRRQTITEEIATIDTMLLDGGMEIGQAEDRLKDLEGQEIARSGRLSEVQGQIDKVQGELDAHLKEVSQDRESSFQVAVQMADKKNRLTTSQSQVQILQRQLDKGTNDAGSLQEQIKKAEGDQTRLGEQLQQIDHDLEDGRKTLVGEQARLQKVERDLKRNEDELTAASDQIKIATAKRNILEELRHGTEGGISRGVREVLALKDRELQGVFGMVGDLVTVPKGYETAFEVALGASIQDLVVSDAETAQKAINLLKQRKAGRATFLPLDMIKPPSRTENPKVPGCVGVALDLVEYDARFYTIMNHLLGRILIFQDLDRAVAFARNNRTFNRIVTVDGDVIRSSGAMTGGAESQRGTGLFARKRELEDLETRLRTLAVTERQLSSGLPKLRNERIQLVTSIRQREDGLVRAEQSREFFVRSLAKIEEDLVVRRKDFTHLDTDRRDLEQNLQRLEKLAIETRQELVQLESQNQELTTRLQALGGREEGIQSRLGSLRGLQNDEKMALVQLVEQKKAARREMDLAIKRRRDAQERKDRAASEVARLVERLKEVDAQISLQQGEFVKLEEERLAAEKGLEALQQEYQACAKELDTFDHTYQSRSKILDSTRAKMGELDIRLAEIKTNIQNKESTLTVDYGLDLAQIGSNLRKHESREELTLRIATRKAEQSALEPVNPLAIEDYEKTKERFDFFTAQIKDMTDAAFSLEQVISEIEKISLERFLDTLRQVNSAFGEIFQVVFPGGSAQLKLSNPENALESNIEIVCQLPGKKLSTLELFSGGEKALISISLLFAILQVKPPAFCVLDEVDAALDEANVKRFTRLLRGFADKSQFLVITHNKETMQAVDVIYGITLEKTGVSRPISIRLEDRERIREFTVRKPGSVGRAQGGDTTTVTPLREATTGQFLPAQENAK